MNPEAPIDVAPENTPNEPEPDLVARTRARRQQVREQ